MVRCLDAGFRLILRQSSQQWPVCLPARDGCCLRIRPAATLPVWVRELSLGDRTSIIIAEAVEGARSATSRVGAGEGSRNRQASVRDCQNGPLESQSDFIGPLTRKERKNFKPKAAHCEALHFYRFVACFGGCSMRHTPGKTAAANCP